MGSDLGSYFRTLLEEDQELDDPVHGRPAEALGLYHAAEASAFAAQAPLAPAPLRSRSASGELPQGVQVSTKRQLPYEIPVGIPCGMEHLVRQNPFLHRSRRKC